jgi:hypothetical protein
MSRHIDEHELRALFEGIEVPPGLDRWRERIADVHAEACDAHQDDTDPEDTAAEEEATDGTTVVAETNGVVIALPTGRELRPRRQRTKSVAVAAAAAVVVGLGGVVVTSQLLSDAPPADDPTMIIDGPDRTISSMPQPTSEEDAPPSGSATSPPPQVGGTGQDDPPNAPDGGIVGDGETRAEKPLGNEPSWPAMVGDPTADNTGVPLSASLDDHYGDLRITTAGQVVSDLRVTGTIIVDAPNVTLRRVLVVAQFGAAAVRQNSTNLTVENSELAGGSSVIQSSSGLVVRRSRIEAGVTLASGAELYDNYVNISPVLIPSGSRNILLRHNTMGTVTMNDLDAPISNVSIENNLLAKVDAPTEPGSASIHVLGNRFRDNPPSTGWNPSGTDYRWSGNTFADSGAPANH